MNNKHFEITLDNGHWPLTRCTTDVTDAYECIASILDSRPSQYPGYKTGFLMALASMVDSKTKEYSSQGISVRLVDGEV